MFRRTSDSRLQRARGVKQVHCKIFEKTVFSLRSWELQTSDVGVEKLYFSFWGQVYFYFLLASVIASQPEQLQLSTILKVKLFLSNWRHLIDNSFLQLKHLCLYVTHPLVISFAGNRSVINFREAVAAREKAETAEKIRHLLLKYKERGEVRYWKYHEAHYKSVWPILI